MITRIVELRCDTPTCDVTYTPTPDELTSLQLTRTGSATAGWVRQDGRDYCPAHARNTPRGVLVDTIRTLAGKCLTDEQIGKRLGLSRGTVQQIRSEQGIPSGVGVGRPPILGRRTVVSAGAR